MKEKKNIRWVGLAVLTTLIIASTAAGVLLIRKAKECGGIQTDVKREFTEEEKEYLESQPGVSVREDGVVEVNVAERKAAEETVAVTRQAAQEKALMAMSEEAEILSSGLQKETDGTYWIVRAQDSGEVYQIWISAETGDISRSMRE